MIFKRTAKLNALWLLLVCFLYVSPASDVFGVHIMAGEITAKSDTTSATPNLLRYHFKLVTYVLNRDVPDLSATLFFGDGTSQSSPKVSETLVLANPKVYRRVYYFNHVYAAGGRNYTVTYSEQNRNASIVNMKDPSQTNFLLQTTISINPQLGINRSPQFSVPPLDLAAQGQIYTHLPGAYDLDQDSLSYVLKVPLRNAGTPQAPQPMPVFEYKYPNDPQFGGRTVADGTTLPNQPAILRLDPRTGEIRWNTPGLAGHYNIAFVVEEWKIIPGHKPIKIGEVMRDMQIIVKPGTINLPPILTIPRDTCIVALTTLKDTVSAVDGDIPPNPKDELVPIQAFGGVVTFKPGASYNPIPPKVPYDPNVPIKLAFSWTPTCNDVSAKPYEVVFRVADIPEQPQPSLSALKSWNITVVAPAPKNLIATALPNRRVSLTWNNYAQMGCANASKIRIYRKENLANFIPQACETGVPAFTGYTLIGEVPANVNTFTDDNKGAGLKMGANFCYIIYAEFPLPKGGKSLASNEACAEVPILTSVMTNVSILETSKTTGRIFVRWTQPVGDIANFTGPYQYRLFRSAALPGATALGTFKQIYTTPNVTTDTSFTDINRNTQDSVYTYKVEFYYTTTPAPGGPAQLTLLENGPTASSVRLEALSNGPTMQLTWSYNVPWDNSLRKHLIYRKINNVFTLIDSVQAGPAGGTYTDPGTFGNQPLIVGKVYCYYVQTVGFFTYSKLQFGVRNNSQELCQIVRDTTSPCPPVVILTKLNCDSLENLPYSPPTNKLTLSNKLNWVTSSGPECGKDIQSFNVYFRPTDTGEFTKIANTLDSAYLHTNLSTTAGCYVITAVDSSGNESRYSNVVCQDICYFFDLPNIFTPNNDNVNDLFVPRQASFVRSVKFRVYNRWGQQVYESADEPNINWPGTTKQGNKVSDGVYYYHAEVEFVGVNAQSVRKLFKGWVQIVR